MSIRLKLSMLLLVLFIAAVGNIVFIHVMDKNGQKTLY